MNSWEFNNDILKLSRNHKQSTNSTINFHGGTITSWKVLNVEQLFIREECKFDNINPIQGGIHVLFPNFNMDNINMPNNGFARYCKWKKSVDPYIINNNIGVEIELKENNVMKALRWNHPFYLNLNIILGLTTLTTIVGVYNPDPERSISFNLAVETYIRLKNIEECEIFELDGCEYTDKANCIKEVDQETPLVITEKLDRIYHNAKDKIFIHDLSEQRKIIVNKLNFPELFISNPWIGEYNQMICVAPGYISQRYTLTPKTWFYAGQRFEILPLLQDQQLIPK